MPDLALIQIVLAVASGALVGTSLGLVGGGGSILAVPLLVYVVGMGDAHLAIGTSAVAVAANALASLVAHARASRVKWRCALVFAASGIVGAFAGSTVGKAIDGQHLLALFSVLMLVVATVMLLRRQGEGNPAVRLSGENLPRLIVLGFATGALSGFFGIGGGFLIVPALMLATGMPILNAVASSLVAVTAFGVTTAANYAWSGYVDWVIAAVFIVGGVAGSIAGARLSAWLAGRRGLLDVVFAGVIGLVAIAMLVHSLGII